MGSDLFDKKSQLKPKSCHELSCKKIFSRQEMVGLSKMFGLSRSLKLCLEVRLKEKSKSKFFSLCLFLLRFPNCPLISMFASLMTMLGFFPPPYVAGRIQTHVSRVAPTWDSCKGVLPAELPWYDHVISFVRCIFVK